MGWRGLKGVFQGGKRHRDLGDSARSRQDWPTAETQYAEHLKQWPSHGEIWVQYGHALKEQGKLGDAEAAYRHALGLDADDADLLSHLAHLLKRTGAHAEAARQFGRLFQLRGLRSDYDQVVDLVAPEAREELLTVGKRALEGPTIFIELDDLFGFFADHNNVTGIQRVQLSVICYALQAKHPPNPACAFVLGRQSDRCLWRVSAQAMEAIVVHLQRGEGEHAALKDLVRSARQGATAVHAKPGDTYLILGAFWNLGLMGDSYRKIKQSGAAIGIYIYDLIPITHPEYCDRSLSHEFTLAMGDALVLADFVLAISDYTAREFRKFAGTSGLQTGPVATVRLAGSSEFLHPQPEAAGIRGKAADAATILRGRPFVLTVSTIEVRKNHAYILTVWKHLLDEGLDPPDLVFVGRRGWRVNDLMEMLEATGNLKGRVHLLHDVSDPDLGVLYDGCLFTLFPSFVEGWGLPVGESLARGKPCVASSTSAIPEIGGDFIDYIDPLNARDGIEIIRRLAFDEKYRARRSAEIQARFQPRTWNEVAADLLQTAERLGASAIVDPQPRIKLHPGEIFRPGRYNQNRPVPPDYASRPLRSLLGAGWRSINDLGCWMHGQRAELQFRCEFAPGKRVIVYLGFRTSADLIEPLEIVVHVNDEYTARSFCASGSTKAAVVTAGRHPYILASGIVGADGVVTVKVKVNAEAGVLGLSSLAYADAEAPLDRLLLAERLLTCEGEGA